MYIYQIMSNSFGYIDIILLGMIAGFIILRLRSILGRKTVHESKVYPGFAEKEFNIRQYEHEYLSIDLSGEQFPRSVPVRPCGAEFIRARSFVPESQLMDRGQIASNWSCSERSPRNALTEGR